MGICARKVALGVVTVLLVGSIVAPYMMAKRLTQELWKYVDADTGNTYMLLAKVSEKHGGIFGATNTIEPGAVSDRCVPFSRSRKCVLLVKVVDSFMMPEGREYQWVSARSLEQAVKFALLNQNFKDVPVESHYGARIVVDARLLEALSRGEYEMLGA